MIQDFAADSMKQPTRMRIGKMAQTMNHHPSFGGQEFLYNHAEPASIYKQES